MTDNPLLGAHSSSGWYFQNPGHHQKHFILFDLPFFFLESLSFLSKIEAAPPYEHADKDVGDRVV